jgi:hypothetical protein
VQGPILVARVFLDHYPKDQPHIRLFITVLRLLANVIPFAYNAFVPYALLAVSAWNRAKSIPFKLHCHLCS